MNFEYLKKKFNKEWQKFDPKIRYFQWDKSISRAEAVLYLCSAGLVAVRWILREIIWWSITIDISGAAHTIGLFIYRKCSDRKKMTTRKKTSTCFCWLGIILIVASSAIMITHDCENYGKSKDADRLSESIKEEADITSDLTLSMNEKEGSEIAKQLIAFRNDRKMLDNAVKLKASLKTESQLFTELGEYIIYEEESKLNEELEKYARGAESKLVEELRKYLDYKRRSKLEKELIKYTNENDELAWKIVTIIVSHLHSLILIVQNEFLIKKTGEQATVKEELEKELKEESEKELKERNIPVDPMNTTPLLTSG